jgi:hypothetical protein
MGLINLGECESKAGAFVCRVPDLTDLGGEYCISVVAITDPRINDHMPGPHRQVDIRANCCGGTFGMKDFQIQRVPMPDTGDGHFNLGPDTTRKFTKDTLTWTGPEEPLQQLNLGSCAYGSCLVAYLDKSSFSWADLETTGMTYLRGFPLLASVSAYYPPVSVDALAAGVGRFSDRVTWQRADSRVVDMGLADPPKRAPSASSPKSPDVQDLAKLPTCSGMIQAHSFGQLNPAMDDKSIRVRGILAPNLQDCIVLDRGYAYGRERPCGFATWALADPENLDNKMPLRRQGAPLRTGVSDRAPDARPVEVIASGTLRARAPRAPDFGDTRDEYSLDEVALCAVRPPSPPAGE